MTIHQCPDCPLRFRWKTELLAHLRDEHPPFHSLYPVAKGGAKPAPAPQEG